MKKKGKKMNFKKGAASFYIVAFSTLILMIVAASFIGIIVSEVARTSNDDLSQSAYDSALAGIEDAKLAFYKYQECKGDSGVSLDDEALAGPLAESASDCIKTVWYVENTYSGYDECATVANILGRENGDGGVVIQEKSGGGNNMQQAYTCVTMKTDLRDYRATLSETDSTKVIPAKFDETSIPGVTNNIEKVKISWFSADNVKATFSSDNIEYTNFNSGGGIFDEQGKEGRVPTIALGIVQTGTSFSLDDFETTKNGKTNRGMVYLAPTDDISDISGEGNGYYEITTGNTISSIAFSKSNDKTTKNLPYVVECNDEAEFLCSATIDLPKPIGDDARNADTFMIIVSLPYGPSTDFSLEFECAEGATCGKKVNAETGEEENTNVAKLAGAQVKIDSTGRANDLYRRVEVRLSPASAANPYALYGIQLLGENDGKSLLQKELSPTFEWNFN